MAHTVEPEDEAAMKIKQKRMPDKMTETRGVTPSAGGVAFDEVLVKKFKDIVAQARGEAEQIKPEAIGEEGPVVGPAAAEPPLPHPYQHGDDVQEKRTVRRRGH
jgi:hypothetical protein